MTATAIRPYKGRDPQPIIERALELYEQGDQEIEQIASEVATPARTLYRWLATNATERWKEALQARALADYEIARKSRETANNNLVALQNTLEEEEITDAAERNWRLMHAREVLRAADVQLDHQKWLLERLLSRLYGQKQEVQHTVAPVLHIHLAQDVGTVIEHQPPVETK